MLDLYTAAKIGPTTLQAFDNVTPAALPFAASNPIVETLFVVYTDANVYIRQGDSTVVAAATDMLLPANSYIGIVVESSADAYLSCLGSAGSGTVRATNGSRIAT